MNDSQLYAVIVILLVILAVEVYVNIIRCRPKKTTLSKFVGDDIFQAEVAVYELEALERVGYEQGWADHARKHSCSCETARSWNL